ncbi:MAG: ATP-binding cassette domain-containing protein [Neisseriaceae bacterium]|nr:ATP-binding cassette domain-containing protein [Neisseriaceae bacterium]
MIDIKNLSLSRGTKELISNSSVFLPDNKRVGLIGRNGSGKSSFFSLLLNEIDQDNGDVITPANQTYAIIKQETPSLDCSAIDYVLSGDQKRNNLLQALEIAIQNNNANQIADINQQLEDIDAYTAPAKAGKLLSGLGFHESQHSEPVKSFSGGWRMRLNLAQALLTPADVLLLDEPTNHLDLETVLWLESYLIQQNNTQIIISHDRNFLNKVTELTLELAQNQLTLYSGNYDFYEKEKANRLALQQAQYNKQQNQIKHLQSFVDRFRYKATKAKQAQSRIKALEKMELIAPIHLESQFDFSFFPVGNLPNPMLKFENLVIGYDVPISEDMTFSIEAASRIGLLGVNGSGKSTLIKTIIGDIPKLSGSIFCSEKVKIGYFAQHQLDYLDPNDTPLNALKRIAPNEKEQLLRNYLGGYNFNNDKVNEKIQPFSGGEKARLALALIVWQQPNFLLLDEPTNHLDIDMRTALTWALQSFEGAMILVSHDRNLLEATCDEFIYLQDKKLHILKGDLDDYHQQTVGHNNTNNTPSSSEIENHYKKDKVKQAQLRQAIADNTKDLKKQAQSLEKNLHLLEKQQQEIENFLISEEAYQDENKQRLQENIILSQKIKQDMQTTEEEWLNIQETIENKGLELIQQFENKD